MYRVRHRESRLMADISSTVADLMAGLLMSVAGPVSITIPQGLPSIWHHYISAPHGAGEGWFQRCEAGTRWSLFSIFETSCGPPNDGTITRQPLLVPPLLGSFCFSLSHPMTSRPPGQRVWSQGGPFVRTTGPVELHRAHSLPHPVVQFLLRKASTHLCCLLVVDF